jgi:hypothetical protein
LFFHGFFARILKLLVLQASLTFLLALLAFFHTSPCPASSASNSPRILASTESLLPPSLRIIFQPPPMIKSGDYLAANETCPNIVLHASSIEFSEPERLVLQSDAFGNAIAQWPDASEPDLALN